jgi:hypothetical protein
MKTLLALLLFASTALAEDPTPYEQCASQYSMLVNTYKICSTRLTDISKNYNLLLFYFLEVADEYNRRHRLIRKLKRLCGERCRGIK